MSEDRMLFKEDVARRARVNPPSVTLYLAKARKRREEGTATVSDLPEPAAYVRREFRRRDGRAVHSVVPVWSEPEITAWLARRTTAPPGRTRSFGDATSRMTVRLPRPLRVRTGRVAAEEGMTLADAIRTAVEGWCDEREAVRDGLRDLEDQAANIREMEAGA